MQGHSPVVETGGYANITSDTLVAGGKGSLLGIFVASASASPTIKIWDNTSAATTVIVNTFTPVAGTFYPLPFDFGTGLYVDVGGTLDITVCWRRRD